MKVVGYCRVSSREQAKDGLSLEMQTNKIEAYCALNDLELVEIITDAGISAKNISGRPGMKKALDMVLNGNVDGLVAYKLDRMFRSTIDALNVAEQFRKSGKCLMSICEKLDTSSALGEFFFSLMASLAQMERRLTAERTLDVFQSKRDKGEFVGKPKYGFTPEGKNLVSDAEQQVVIQQVKNMSGSMSYRAIAKSLNEQGILTKQAKCWTHKQVSAILA